MDSTVCVLDLDIRIENGKFISAVYDKCDDFKFDIVQFQPVYNILIKQAQYLMEYSVHKYYDILEFVLIMVILKVE